MYKLEEYPYFEFEKQFDSCCSFMPICLHSQEHENFNVVIPFLLGTKDKVKNVLLKIPQIQSQ